METQKIWNNFNEELYFFILKKLKNKNAAQDIFQNTFLKIHKNIPQLKDEEKARAWVFQIARNEVNNYFREESVYVEKFHITKEAAPQQQKHFCCFDKFINELPQIYGEVIELVYIEGKKQKEVATHLSISLENVKARIRRAKSILKKRFNECCKYEIDKNGDLTGESNCAICES
ncbi:sigma-70 family RNA polymerase sigma factor [Mesonia sp. MT50]|uniref:Sigma-70 family RNA polymerase sigma factor n=1 Tax=Mesonia profundi TaxID=3070998 RepID=A0ABU1A425_9FLAO|nr:sigma-70 family RNA polymerase sigma factor [Mesonia profundi]MDQ7918385.1 sigma-70 family RNA polymerase sigma factor [Mesonia profundi]